MYVTLDKAWRLEHKRIKPKTPTLSSVHYYAHWVGLPCKLGWTPHYRIVTLEVMGTIHKDASTAMNALGISPFACERVLSAWVTMTLAHINGDWLLNDAQLAHISLT